MSWCHASAISCTYDQLYPNAEVPGNQVELNLCPQFGSNLKVYNSATATYYTPGDQSGVGGVHCDIIHCTLSWQGEPARKDTVFVENGGAEGEGLCGLLVARVCLLFLFPYKLKKYWCILVEWFLLVADEPDDVTGMWIVAPEEDQQGHRVRAVIGLDTILRPVHLIGMHGDDEIPVYFQLSDTLDAFCIRILTKVLCCLT